MPRTAGKVIKVDVHDSAGYQFSVDRDLTELLVHDQEDVIAVIRLKREELRKLIEIARKFL